MRMMNVGLGVVLALVAVQPASSQVQLGARVGASISDLSLDVEDIAPDLDSRTGILVGGFVDVPLSGGFSFQPGLQYVQKGAAAEDIPLEPGEQATLDLELGLDYLELPLLFKYTFPTEGSVGVHLYGGPALAVEVGCDVTVASGGVTIGLDCDEAGDGEVDIEVFTTSFDFGALFGGGVAVPAGPAELSADVFYNLGLANVFDTESDDESAKNRAFYLTLGVGFPVN